MGDWALNGDWAANGDWAGVSGGELDGALFSVVASFPQGSLVQDQALAGQLFSVAGTFPQGIITLDSQNLAGQLFSVVGAFPTGILGLEDLGPTIYAFDGFDFFHPATHGFNIHNWQSPSGSAIAYPGEGLLGGYAWGFDNTNQLYEHLNLPSLTTIVVGFWMKPSFSTIANARTFMQLRHSSGAVSSLQMNQAPSGSITVNGQTTASGIWTADTWDFWELRVVVSTTVGEVELRKNRETVLSATGLNTGSTAIDRIRFQGNVDMDYKFEDVYIADDFLGPILVAHLKPVADSTPNEFTASTGTDEYAMLDDVVSDASLYAHVHDEDGTYVTSSTDGHKSVFDLADLPSIGSYTQPLAVEVYNYGREESAVAANYRAGIKSGSAEAYGPEWDSNLSDSFYGWINHPADTSPSFIKFFTDPDGDVPWTTAAIDALQVVIENTAAFPIRVTGLGVQVLLALGDNILAGQPWVVIADFPTGLITGGIQGGFGQGWALGWGIPIS